MECELDMCKWVCTRLMLSSLCRNYAYRAGGNYLNLDFLENSDKGSKNSIVCFQNSMWLRMNGCSCHMAIVCGEGFGANIDLMSPKYNDPDPSIFNIKID